MDGDDSRAAGRGAPLEETLAVWTAAPAGLDELTEKWTVTVADSPGCSLPTVQLYDWPVRHDA